MKSTTKNTDMKKVEDKKGTSIPFKKHPTAENVTTKTIIDMLFKSSMPPEGITLSQMASRVSVLNKFEDKHKDSTVVDFNDADAKEILESFKKSKWPYIDGFILEVAADFGVEI